MSLENIFDASKVYNASYNKVAFITIAGVEGILLNKVAISFSAEWRSLIESAAELLGPIDTIANLAGKSLMSTGIYTQKFYKGGGGYLKLSPQFRVIDEMGNGKCITAASTIFSHLAPRGVDNGKDAKKFHNDKDFFGSFEGIEDMAHALMGDFSASSPESVKISISGFIGGGLDYCIESASVTFSTEMTDKGPLYADFDITASSLMAMTADQMSAVMSSPIVSNGKKTNNNKQSFANGQATA